MTKEFINIFLINIETETTSAIALKTGTRCTAVLTNVFNRHNFNRDNFKGTSQNNSLKMLT